MRQSIDKTRIFSKKNTLPGTLVDGAQIVAGEHTYQVGPIFAEKESKSVPRFIISMCEAVKAHVGQAAVGGFKVKVFKPNECSDGVDLSEPFLTACRAFAIVPFEPEAIVDADSAVEAIAGGGDIKKVTVRDQLRIFIPTQGNPTVVDELIGLGDLIIFNQAAAAGIKVGFDSERVAKVAQSKGRRGITVKKNPDRRAIVIVDAISSSQGAMESVKKMLSSKKMASLMPMIESAMEKMTKDEPEAKEPDE